LFSVLFLVGFLRSFLTLLAQVARPACGPPDLFFMPGVNVPPRFPASFFLPLGVSQKLALAVWAAAVLSFHPFRRSRAVTSSPF